ncbi:MAG: hypothetical protein E2O68_09145 [Deltaproteobacteria bacterium]|nr:MAG: hypothetical protein E2O68_09145 [Deltaproteobacteria bacterium]
MPELEKCLVDVLIEFYQGKPITKWAYVSLREIENYLRDVNTGMAFPPEMAQEDLFYSWVGQLIYEVLTSMAHCSKSPQNWDELSQVERIKKVQSILEGQLLKTELIDLVGNEATISLRMEGEVFAPIQNALALYIRDLLRRELAHSELEILLES